MANRWGNNGNSEKLYFGGAPKSLQMVTAAMKLRRLLLGREVMTNLDSIFKSRDITLPTKVCLVRATVFPGVMHGCKSWTVRKAEHQGIDAFELWCWRRLLRVPWTARRSVLPKNTQDWSPLEWTGWISLQSKGLSRVFSNTTVQRHQFFGAQLSSQSNSHIHTWLLEKP